MHGMVCAQPGAVLATGLLGHRLPSSTQLLSAKGASTMPKLWAWWEREGCALLLSVWADQGVQVCSLLLAKASTSTSQPCNPGPCPARVVIWALQSWGLRFSWWASSVGPSPPGQQRGSQRGLPSHRAQAGRARDGLVGSSPLLFPKQPARRCHTRAHGCTRKPSHSLCGKEVPATTCEYCLRVVLPPFPCAQSRGCVPAALLWGRERKREAVSDPSWQLPPPQCRLNSFVCQVPGAAPPVVFQGRVLLK